MATDKAVTEETPHGKWEGSTMVNSLMETKALAERLLPVMKSVPCVSLEGPLGAGKTHFVKATAELLDLGVAVSSPTFTLLHSYSGGSCPLHHGDWYRMESPGEVLALGLEDYQGDGMMMIEWGDKFPELLPPGTLRIRIEPVHDTQRRFTWHLTQGTGL
jgi:tRNA threonylcarbamoyladenosine biosynthesis protein TsaE